VSKTTCQPGSFVSDEGSATKDRSCAVCPTGESSTTTNAPSCAAQVVQVVAGADHTCVLFSDGTVKCWGSDAYGQLGYGNLNNIGDDELPSAVGKVSVTTTPGVTVVELSAGSGFTCASLSDGTGKCWGYNGGELGYGNTNNIGDDELPSSVGAVSVTTASGVTIKRLTAGGSDTCAVLSDGSGKCWGNDFYDQLGDGNAGVSATIGDNELPSSIGSLKLTSATGVSVTQFASGEYDSCALLSNGTMKCWGNDGFGQLGYGFTADSVRLDTVGAVSVTTQPGLAITQISSSLGSSHTCALLSDGSGKCWGSNSYGQLGDGDLFSIGDNELPSSVGPISVTSTAGVTIKQLVAGGLHTCALLSDGTVKCWGDNEYGQLGYGNVALIPYGELPSSVGPVSLTTTAGVTVTQLSAGLYHTCALLSDASVRCWGLNNHGQLGYGNLNNIGDNELPSSVGPVPIF
jgi:alpha-tubulin suppressor-like RCC1 family protein